MGNLKYDMKQNCIAHPFKDGSGKQIQDKDTVRVYRRSINNFCGWVKNTYGINNSRQLKAAGGAVSIIQEYARKLEAEGKSASTIHTYLAPVCKGLGVHMGEIKKPRRSASDMTRSRDVLSNRQGKKEAMEKKNLRLVEFQKMAGIRRSELGRLKVSDFQKDESGYFCVVVNRGKGGKKQLQRILPEDMPKMKVFLRSMLDTVSSSDLPRDKIALFTKEEMNNKIDLHRIRADHARDAYQHYLGRCRTKEGKTEVQRELVERWNACHGEDDKITVRGRRFYASSACGRRFIDEFAHEGKYQLRGSNKSRCLEIGRPIAYDRTALLAVSVFHLSHWRNDVTVKHYML